MDKNVVLVINLYTYLLICMQKTIVRVGGIMRDIKYMELKTEFVAHNCSSFYHVNLKYHFL